MNNEQKVFINKHFKKSASDIWLENLVKLKALAVDDKTKEKEFDNILDEWLLIDIKIANNDTRPYKCMCGKNLKIQYVVKHNTRKITYNFGSECMKKYLGIDSSLVHKILRQKRDLNANVDEIISKIGTFEIDKQLFLLDYKKLPNLMREQLLLEIPLCDKQLKKALKIISENDLDVAYENISKLDKQALDYVNDLDFDDRQRLIVTLNNKRKVYTINELKQIKFSEIELRDKPLKLAPIPSLVKRPKSGLSEEELSNINKASNLLSERQKQFWRSKMSLNQRIETSKYIINKKNIYGIDIIGDISNYDMRKYKYLKEQIQLGIPLTEKQKFKLGL